MPHPLDLDDEIRYEIRVFDLILFFASEEGIKPLPNSEAGLLLEMARATMEYLGGEINKVPSPDGIPWVDGWPVEFDQAIKLALKQNDKHLNSALVKALDRLLTVEWKNDHGEKWWESGIRPHLIFRQRGMDNTFYLTVPTVAKVRKNIEKYFDADALEHCTQIGILMRKYIAENSKSH